MSVHRIQSARTVAYRSLCLGALLRRSGLEISMTRLSELPEEIRVGWRSEHEGIHQRLREWLQEEKISNYFSSNEQQLIDAELGDWQQMDLINVTWRVESLGMMLWALDVVEAPYYDTQFDPDTLLEPLDLLNPTIDFIWQATLREPEIILQARDLAEMWHWRSRTTQLRKRGVTPPDGKSFDDIIRTMAEKAYAEGNIPEILDGDLPVFNKPYTQLTEDEYTAVTSIAMERHYAMNWICGYSENWDSVPTDT